MLGYKPLDVRRGHMAFDDIAIDLGGMAGGELGADPGLPLDLGERRRLGGIDLRGEAVCLEVLDPIAAALDSANSGRMAMGVSSYCSAASHFAPDKSGAQFRLLDEGDLVPA